MVQWVNLSQNNRSVIAHQYSALSIKAGPVLLPLVGLTAGRLTGWLAGWETKCGRFQNFYNSLQAELFVFLLPLILL